MTSFTPGSSFGAYRVIEPLGRGGMASVYRAYEAALDRYVALKVLPAEFMHDEGFAERFRREARVVAKLEHRRIVPIYNFGIEEGIPWMTMRLVPGGTVSSLLKQGHLDHARTLAILKESAEALDHAHSLGVLHRDVKPQNILLDQQGHVYLADFGIAKMIEGSTVVTKTGIITGTPQYMSPEQARAQKVDHRTDIYALGIVAYEMLTGQVPFSADTPVAVLMKHIMDPIPIPAASAVPEPLLRPLLKCLDKTPDDRWQAASAFVRALEAGMAAPAGGPTAEVAASSVELLTGAVAIPTPPGRTTPAVATSPTNTAAYQDATEAVPPASVPGPRHEPPQSDPDRGTPRQAWPGALGAAITCGVALAAAWAVVALPGGDAAPATVVPSGASEAPVVASPPRGRRETVTASKTPLGAAPKWESSPGPALRLEGVVTRAEYGNYVGSFEIGEQSFTVSRGDSFDWPQEGERVTVEYRELMYRPAGSETWTQRDRQLLKVSRAVPPSPTRKQ